MRTIPEIRPLAALDAGSFVRLAAGYTSSAKYAVRRLEEAARFTLTLEQVPLVEPYVKHWDYSAEELARYDRMVQEEGLSFGAFAGDTPVGIAIGAAQVWNRTLWAWEIHVDPAWRGQGIGRGLVERLAAAGREAGLRTLLVEVQNTNAPAIAFYRRLGFALEGLDLSYYTNDDVEAGEVALFFKLRLR